MPKSKNEEESTSTSKFVPENCRNYAQFRSSLQKTKRKMRRKITSTISSFLLYRAPRTLFFSSQTSLQIHCHYHNLATGTPVLQGLQNFCTKGKNELFSKPTSLFNSSVALRYLTGSSSEIIKAEDNDDKDVEVEPIDLWEEEEEVESKIGDGGDGGGVVLQNCPWGERALSIAHVVLRQFGDDMKLYAFKTSPRGYIYVRLDKLSNEYGCPSIDEIESFSKQYKTKLDEIGATGEIPDDLALEVSSPGAERLLKVPDDLDRFKEMPMKISYVENMEAQSPDKNGVFLLESIEMESGCCVWKLADVKQNRDPSAKGRPLSRKQKDWRLRLPYDMFKRVTLFLDY